MTQSSKDIPNRQRPSLCWTAATSGSKWPSNCIDRERRKSCSIARRSRLARSVERSGIKPRTDVLARRELEKRHVPPGDLESLPEARPGKSKFVAVLAEWLRQHPNESLTLPKYSRFESRTCEAACDRRSCSTMLTSSRFHIVLAAQRHWADGETQLVASLKERQGGGIFVNGWYFILGYHLFRLADEANWVERTDFDLWPRAAFDKGSKASLWPTQLASVS